MRPLTSAQRVELAPVIVWIAVSTGVVLLGSSSALSLRESLGGLVGWSLGLALSAFMLSFISKAVAEVTLESAGLREQIETTSRARIDVATAEGCSRSCSFRTRGGGKRTSGHAA